MEDKDQKEFHDSLRKTIVALRAKDEFKEVKELTKPKRDDVSWRFAQLIGQKVLNVCPKGKLQDYTQSPQKTNLTNFVNGSGAAARPAEYHRMWKLVNTIEGNPQIPTPIKADDLDETGGLDFQDLEEDTPRKLDFGAAAGEKGKEKEKEKEKEADEEDIAQMVLRLSLRKHQLLQEVQRIDEELAALLDKQLNI